MSADQILVAIQYTFRRSLPVIHYYVVVGWACIMALSIGVTMVAKQISVRDINLYDHEVSSYGRGYTCTRPYVS